VDGRASWAKIASVLAEPERTVARRGAELLGSGQVRVRALPNPGRIGRTEQFVLKASCSPGTAGIAAAALARRTDSLFTYLLTGSADCAAEISVPAAKVAELTVREIGTIPGVASAATYPVLTHYRTMHQWDPGILSEEEKAQLGGAAYSSAPIDLDGSEGLGKEDRILAQALMQDGRASFEDLGRASGLSVQTVQRRVERMRRDGALYLRAVFEPALIGLPVEALLWVRVPFSQLDGVASMVLESSAVRYAAALAGDFQLVVDAVFESRSALYDYLRHSDWITQTQSIEPALVLEALKRSGTLAAHFGDTQGF
jgi:DNA-binding Lrp family transcriptional regulator